MKIIGVDGRLYSQTGVGTYIRNLVRELNELKPDNIHFYLYVLPDDKKKIHLNPAIFTLKKAPYKWHTFSEQTQFLYQLTKDRLDLMHFTYFGYPILYSGKFIATIHDLTPLFFKTGKSSTKNSVIYEIKHLFFTQVLKAQVFGSRYIITPTKTVKSQLISHYGTALDTKTFPIYEGIDLELQGSRECKVDIPHHIAQNFFLYVGNFYPHKNIKTLVQAMKSIDLKYSLLLVGPEDYFARKTTEYIMHMGMDKRIYVYHPKSKGELIYLYKRAKALIHPSLSEGFGLPLIEADYFGCPVIASDIPVFKELLGESYIAFDPNSVSSISRGIIKHLETSQRRNNHIKPRVFSFQEMAKQTLALYWKALNQN